MHDKQFSQVVGIFRTAIKLLEGNPVAIVTALALFTIIVAMVIVLAQNAINAIGMM